MNSPNIFAQPIEVQKWEIKLIIGAILSLMIICGCFIIIGVSGFNNCALNNGLISLLTSIISGWLGYVFGKM